MTIGQVGKVLKEQWDNLPKEDQRPYDLKEMQDKKRYEDEKAAYNAKKVRGPRSRDMLPALTSTLSE